MHSSFDISVIRFREKMEYIACVRQMRRGYITVVEGPTEETTWNTSTWMGNNIKMDVLNGLGPCDLDLNVSG
jgi:hypothetical protein